MRVKDTLESKTARIRLRKNALSYITDLEDIRKQAKNQGDLRLAAEITEKLLDHAIGKPRMRVEADINEEYRERGNEFMEEMRVKMREAATLQGLISKLEQHGVNIPTGLLEEVGLHQALSLPEKAGE